MTSSPRHIARKERLRRGRTNNESTAPSTEDGVDFIGALPAELLLHIVRMIPEDDSTRLKTLKALSRVCHRFHALFHPLLFHSLNTHGSFPIRLFSELISSRPVLAGYVKRLSLEGNHTLYYYDDYTTKFKEIDPQIHVTAVGLELGTPKECVGAIMHRTPSELVDLLLACQCPNVEEIETTDPRFLLYTVLEPVARGGSFGKVHRFERLRTLNITVDVLRTYPFINLTVAFRIPTLETLVLRNAALSSEEELNWAADIEEWKSLAGSSPIRNLILKNCGLHCNEIVEAIRACRILRRFDCDFLYIIHKQLGGEAFYPTVLTALMDHRDTLEDLRISETGACNGFRPYMPYEFFSFNECRALKYLHLPLYAIAPPDGSIVVKHPSSPNTHVPKTDYVMIDDVLPPSLRVLNIDMVASREGSSDRFFLSIAELDPGPSVYFTHLKRINVTCRLESQRLSPLLPLHPCHLKRMFASQGIEFLFDVEIVPCLFTSDEFNHFKRCYRRFGGDGKAIEKRFFFGIGCSVYRNFHIGWEDSMPVTDPGLYSSNIYMEPWLGPIEFEVQDGELE